MSLFATFAEALVQARRRKILLPRDFYATIPAQSRARSFTVSGLAATAQIAQVLDSLANAIKSGVDFSTWKSKALSQVSELASLPNGRLETIYRNAMLNAYNAGRYQQMLTNPNRKYWLYDGVIDSRTTEICRALDGKIYPADSPVWRTIHPPNHHNCRSTLIGLTLDQAKARGYRPGVVTPIPKDGQPAPGWDHNPAVGLDDAINAAATAGNAALGRQYAPLVRPTRSALVDFARELEGLKSVWAGKSRSVYAVLLEMLAAVLIALA